MQGQMGSSPPAYPALESRISNARRSCFALGFVFVRMDSMCSHARSVVTAWGREVFPAVDTSSRFHQRASSLSGRSHFWSLNLYSSPSHHRSVGFNKLGRKGAAPGLLQGCSRAAPGELWLHGHCLANGPGFRVSERRVPAVTSSLEAGMCLLGNVTRSIVPGLGLVP